MALDEQLVNDARQLRDRLLDLQHESERARADYQHAIRRLHAAGGSLREIADALGLSHQRVHQIVDESAAAATHPRLASPPLLGPPVRHRRRGFERFTRAARAAVALAQEEAQALGHDYIGTEHLLLGLLRAQGGGAARALDELGVSLDAARAEAAKTSGERGATRRGRRIPFTPAAKRVLENALQEARARRHRRIGTEHVLLALAAEDDGSGLQILTALGVAAPAVAEQVDRLLAV